MKLSRLPKFVAIVLGATLLLSACHKNVSSSDLSNEEISELNASETYPDFPGSLDKVFTSMDELRTAANEIVKVEVLSSEVVPLDNLPQTHTKVKVSEVLKGSVSVGDTLTVVEEGGSNGKLIGDIPQMKAGEEYFLHLTKHQDNYYVSGAFQGRFIIKDGYVFQQGTEGIKLTSYQPLKEDSFVDAYSAK